MSKIVSINGAPLQSVLRIQPGPVVHHLRALWVCGEIGQDAYFLGTMVLGVMQAHGTPTIALSRAQAAHAYTEVRGNVFTGPVSTDRLSFVIALQQLHKWGILNHIEQTSLDESDAAERHFTRSPQLGSDDRWTRDTLIYFRQPIKSAEEYAEQVTTAFRARMSQLNTVVNVNLA